jgi:UDP-N-acetylmuramoylalanine--D-glutamate ligase
MKDLLALNSWHDDWSQAKGLVFGLGVSGFSVADTLVELGAEVIVVAESAEEERLDVLSVLGVDCYIAKPEAENLALLSSFQPDFLIVSPGIKPENPMILKAQQLGIAIWTDIDLAWRVRDKWGVPSQWLCITGTNGKTTVTQMVEAMLNSGGIKAIACGNIGLPILDAIRAPERFSALAVELSSFQLHYLNQIEPLVSAVLNVAEDHLDWHGSFEKYAAAKAKIYNNTKVACVYNAEDQLTYELMSSSSNTDSAQAVGFTKFTPRPNEIGWVEEILVDRAYVEKADQARELAVLEDLAKIPFISPHLLANTAAAAAITLAAGIQPNEIKQALKHFQLDAHRIELVLDQNEVRWVDDSKATNPHAANAALSSFESVIWIVGGLLKGVDISELVRKHAAKLKAAIVIGKERDPVLSALAQFAPNCQVIEIAHQENLMFQVVSKAKSVAQAGDVVLLAPAAASMDQFKDYADRGESFVKAVMEVCNSGD